MNWCSNGAQFHQLCSAFEFFEISNIKVFFESFEIERRKEELIPQILKIFVPTTCSFTVKSQFKLRFRARSA